MNSLLGIILSGGVGGLALFAAGYFLGWKRQSSLVMQFRMDLEKERRRADAKEAELKLHLGPSRTDDELNDIVRGNT